tara:strand:+ start:1640 stop:2656 length:1017 start_codon:yes stop_codon:yes gene_type:complete
MALSQEINQKILIAGSSGMVGSAIYRAFLKKEKEGQYKKTIFFTPTRKELDFSVYSQVEEWFKIYKPQVVIIAAAKVGGIYANKNYPTEFILENLKIQTNLIEVSKLYEVKKLLFLGSSCIYPKFASQPITEEALLTNSLEETNEFYALAKIAGIKLCQALNTQYGFNSICLMPTNLYGPGDNYHPLNSHVLPALIKKICDAVEINSQKITCWGTGNPLREFLYVDDLAEACLFVLENWNPHDIDAPKDKYGSPLYLLNVGSEYEISIKNLAIKISEALGYKGEILWDKSKPDGTPRKKLDISKLKKLGWEASTNLDEGITKTIKAYKRELLNKKFFD